MPPAWTNSSTGSTSIGRVEPIHCYDESYLSIRTPDVLARIQAGDGAWEQMVPDAVVHITAAGKKVTLLWRHVS